MAAVNLIGVRVRPTRRVEISNEPPPAIEPLPPIPPNRRTGRMLRELRGIDSPGALVFIVGLALVIWVGSLG